MLNHDVSKIDDQMITLQDNISHVYTMHEPFSILKMALIGLDTPRRRRRRT